MHKKTYKKNQKICSQWEKLLEKFVDILHYLLFCLFTLGFYAKAIFGS